MLIKELCVFIEKQTDLMTARDRIECPELIRNDTCSINRAATMFQFCVNQDASTSYNPEAHGIGTSTFVVPENDSRI